jgi:chloramphenicol-sensitive protein RarD
MSTSGSRRAAGGALYAAAAYLWWGLFPLYFHALRGVAAPEILAHRILWSAVFMSLLVTSLRGWGDVVRQLRTPGTLPGLALSAVLISTNWLVYVWAVTAGRVVEASLGYYVNPLVTVVLGVIVLREPLTRPLKYALVFAGAGVLVLVIHDGHVPWVAATLALTFALYGLIRKRIRVEAMAGLLAEVGLLSPLAVVYLAWAFATGRSHFGDRAVHSLLLVSSGVVTALPLIWFALGVQRLRLSTIGLLQYLNPTMQLAIAVFVFGEGFIAVQAVSFGCIWVALAIYTGDALRRARRVEAVAGGLSSSPEIPATQHPYHGVEERGEGRIHRG